MVRPEFHIPPAAGSNPAVPSIKLPQLASPFFLKLLGKNSCSLIALPWPISQDD